MKQRCTHPVNRHGHADHCLNDAKFHVWGPYDETPLLICSRHVKSFTTGSSADRYRVEALNEPD